jgi:hypothetical protein
LPRRVQTPWGLARQGCAGRAHTFFTRESRVGRRRHWIPCEKRAGSSRLRVTADESREGQQRASNRNAREGEWAGEEESGRKRHWRSLRLTKFSWRRKTCCGRGHNTAIRTGSAKGSDAPVRADRRGVPSPAIGIRSRTNGTLRERRKTSARHCKRGHTRPRQPRRFAHPDREVD